MDSALGQLLDDLSFEDSKGYGIPVEWAGRVEDACKGDLNAAHSLHNELLPGWRHTVCNETVTVASPQFIEDGGIKWRYVRFKGHDAEPARAWVKAIIRAKQAQVHPDAA